MSLQELASDCKKITLSLSVANSYYRYFLLSPKCLRWGTPLEVIKWLWYFKQSFQLIVAQKTINKTIKHIVDGFVLIFLNVTAVNVSFYITVCWLFTIKVFVEKANFSSVLMLSFIIEFKIFGQSTLKALNHEAKESAKSQWLLQWLTLRGLSSVKGLIQCVAACLCLTSEGNIRGFIHKALTRGPYILYLSIRKTKSSHQNCQIWVKVYLVKSHIYL